MKKVFKIAFEKYVKDTVFDELTDTLIRLFDLIGLLDFDIDKHYKYKLMYNSMREYKHGKKY